ncbi:hypothetical protein DLM45_14965 [Hyphomicrobium methylovorum]|uniref:hypothetical protein n=1 Tax=Hyphomicrobium methylovorum TaxID=84 RepID=UPI0015E6A804|nr:hypothetical protein [Hyphomicrobium methylovorum]MBA2127514.1 hypothetical protein [Hyphomicrobium methylovorum]
MPDSRIAEHLRLLVVALAIAATGTAAYADVWMVKPSGGFGCRDRDALMQLNDHVAAQLRDGVPPAGCVLLYSGERLLDEPEAGIGFADALRVTRADGSTLYVQSSAVVADPGIGSVIDDRSE